MFATVDSVWGRVTPSPLPESSPCPRLWRTPGGYGSRVRTVIYPRRECGLGSTDTGTDGPSWGLAVRGPGSLNKECFRSTPSPPTFFAGMDGGSPFHPAGVLAQNETVRGETAVPPSGPGLGPLLDGIVTCAGGDAGRLTVALEVPHGPVVDRLLDRGVPVFSLHPQLRDRFRDRCSPAGAPSGGPRNGPAPGGGTPSGRADRPAHGGTPRGPGPFGPGGRPPRRPVASARPPGGSHPAYGA